MTIKLVEIARSDELSHEYIKNIPKYPDVGVPIKIQDGVFDKDKNIIIALLGFGYNGSVAQHFLSFDAELNPIPENLNNIEATLESELVHPHSLSLEQNIMVVSGCKKSKVGWKDVGYLFERSSYRLIQKIDLPPEPRPIKVYNERGEFAEIEVVTARGGSLARHKYKVKVNGKEEKSYGFECYEIKKFLLRNNLELYCDYNNCCTCGIHPKIFDLEGKEKFISLKKAAPLTFMGDDILLLFVYKNTEKIPHECLGSYGSYTTDAYLTKNRVVED